MLEAPAQYVHRIISNGFIGFLHHMTATITQLRHFIALAESGSFTRGADSTQRSQAAFSRSIAVLEANLGVSLVERVGHQNGLTAIGRTVLEHARQMVAQADELDQVVKHHASGAAGLVRMGLGPTPSALLSQPLLRLASNQATGMKITIKRGPPVEQLMALRERQLDALVIDLNTIPTARNDLQVQRLCALPIGVLCRPGHPLAKKTTLQLKDLLRYPMAGTGASDAFAQAVVMRFGAAAHPESLLSLRSEDVAELLQAVQISDALFAGVVAPALAELQRGTLKQLSFDAHGLFSEIAWVRLARNTANPVMDGIFKTVSAELAVFETPV